jgi:mannose-6-phosphate isomerase-like protein (cupin superfamily)
MGAVRKMGFTPDTNLTPYALGSEDGEALWFFGTLAIFKATAEQTGGRFSLVEQLARRGMATPLHVHREDDESFYVIEGELTVYASKIATTPYRPPQARSFTSLEELCTPSR